MNVTKSTREKEILLGLKKRKEYAIMWLLEDYGDLMKSVIAYQMRGFPKEEKEECLNQVLFEIWDKAHKFRLEKGNFTGWIAVICKNRSIDIMRKLSKSREEASFEEMEENGFPMPQPDSLDGTKEKLEEMLSGLKKKEREMVEEYYLYGYSVQEIAKKHGMEPAAVYKKIERGIKKCRKKPAMVKG